MDADEDMFATPSSSTGSGNGGSRSLFQVIDVRPSGESKPQFKEETDLMEDAARRRFAKVDAANKSRAQQQHDADSRRSELYDDKDKVEFEEDLENLIDIGAMGEDLSRAPNRRGAQASAKSSRDEYTEILEGERIEPLNMKGEMRRGEVNLYGEMKKKRRRGEEEADPNELAMPPEGSNNGSSGKEKRKKAKRRRGRLSTGESSESESSGSDDDGAGLEIDEDELEELNEDDPWMASVVKSGESGVYHSSVSKVSSSSSSSRSVPQKHAYLKDANIALKEMATLLKEGPVGETVLKLIKHLTPASANRSKRAKINDNDVPSHSVEDLEAQEEAKEKKNKFDKAVNIADYLLDSGYTKIYEMTYEDLMRKFDPKKANREEKEVQTKEIQQGEEGYWQYKWTSDAPEVFGPFDTESMKSWAPSFAQFPGMVVRGFETPAAAQKCSPTENWAPFVPLLWS